MKLVSGYIKKLILIASGQAGSVIASLGVLWLILMFTGMSTEAAIEVTTALLIIRFFYNAAAHSKPALAGVPVRKRPLKIFGDELIIGLSLAATCFAMQWEISRSTMGAFLTANLVIQIMWMHISRYLLRNLAGPSRWSTYTDFANKAVVVGSGFRARKVVDGILNSPELEAQLIGFIDYHRKGWWRYRDIPLIGHPRLLEKIIANGQVDAVIVAVEPEDIQLTKTLFETAEKMGVTICVMPDMYVPTIARPRASSLDGMPTIVYRAVPDNQIALWAKTVVDKIGAAFGLLLSAPFLLIVAAAIKIESRGPVFFKQVRSGLNGKPFKLLKFRTMRADAEYLKKSLSARNEMSGPVFKITDDPRVTRVGRILRKYSVDEVPQFINVLTGQMSLVGPRPPLPDEVSRYEPWQHRKLSVKPGVTCSWQIGGRNKIDFEDWMKLDLEYIDNWSLWEDTKILAKTLPAVLKGRGAS